MLISCLVTAQLICAFIFVCAKRRFSHEANYFIFRYEVLKSHIKETNEDLYKELTSREGVKVIDKKLDQSAKVLYYIMLFDTVWW